MMPFLPLFNCGNYKRNARPAGGTAGRAAETAAFGKAAISCNDWTTSAAGRQSGFIVSLLSHGAENGVTLRHLEKLTDLPGREIRRQIERERRAGALIISDNQHGYYLTDDPAEAQRFARSMQHRAREIWRTAQAVEKAAGGGAQCHDLE